MADASTPSVAVLSSYLLEFLDNFGRGQTKCNIKYNRFLNTHNYLLSVHASTIYFDDLAS